jgi:hypothetical protein
LANALATQLEKNKKMAQKTSTVLRFVAVSGTLAIVALIGIRLVFIAGGLLAVSVQSPPPEPHPSVTSQAQTDIDAGAAAGSATPPAAGAAGGATSASTQISIPSVRLWDATQSLARVLLPLVVFGYIFLFQRKWLPRLRAWNRGVFLGIAFALGVLLAVTVDSRIATAVQGRWTSFVPVLAEPLVGLSLAMLVFLPESLRDLVLKEISPANPSLEERVLSFYFGLLLGLLSYLVVRGFF